jgi:ATP-binding cassette subfamily B protein
MSVPPDGRRIGAPALSVVGQALLLIQGLTYTATVNTARGDIPPFLQRASWIPPRWRIWVMAGLNLVLGFTRFHIEPYRRRVWTQLGQDTTQRLRSAVSARILEQDAGFFERHGTARLARLVADDTDQIGVFLAEGGDDFIGHIVVLLISGITLLVTSPLLFALVAASVPFFLVPSGMLRPRIAETRRLASQSADHFRRLLEDTFNGITDVKSFTAEALELRRIHASGARFASATVEAESQTMLQSQIVETVSHFGLYSAAAYSGHLAAEGRIDQSRYTASLYLIPKLLSVPARMGGLIRQYHRAADSASRLAAILDSEPKVRSAAGAVPAWRDGPGVVFDRVSFGYTPTRRILHEVSFQVRPGETLAVVGPTGSGKSTLLRLLLRFYDPDSGSVSLNGRDLSELNLRGLRQSISLVSQEVYLFEGSIRSNLTLGRPGATDEEIQTVLRLAVAEDIVNRRPEGLEAEVGPGGRRLSGGERQRIAIARALLKGSPILAMDEATSHLDYRTEAAIQGSIRNLAARHSMILIAHRLSSIRQADQILVLDGGRVRERGNHDELVRADGLYALLWRLQQGESPLDGSLELRLNPPEA